MKVRRAAAALMILGSVSTAVAEAPAHTRIAPGMTITDVLALMGPPDAIRSLRWYEALFFCPTSWLGIPIGRPIYTTVWLVQRRVVASRTLIAPNLGTCEAFTTAFQWTDPPPIESNSARYGRDHHPGSSRIDRRGRSTLGEDGW